MENSLKICRREKDNKLTVNQQQSIDSMATLRHLKQIASQFTHSHIDSKVAGNQFYDLVSDRLLITQFQTD